MCEVSSIGSTPSPSYTTCQSWSQGFILSEVRKRGEVLEREKHPNEVRNG